MLRIKGGECVVFCAEAKNLNSRAFKCCEMLLKQDNIFLNMMFSCSWFEIKRFPNVSAIQL